MRAIIGEFFRLLLVGCVLLTTTTQSAVAAVISTEASYSAAQHAQALARVNEVLTREDVRDQLVAWGVDPAAAHERVSALTHSELAALDARLQDLPAGGVGLIEVLGITVFVLLILELLGVTNVFTKI